MNTGKIGLGDGWLNLEVAGRITEADKEHIESVELRIVKSDGSRIIYPATYDGKWARAEVSFDVKGTWIVGVVVHFDNGRSMTSHESYDFLVTDDFPG